MKANTLIPTSAEVLRASGQALQDGHDMQAALGRLLVHYLQTDRGGMQRDDVIDGIQHLHWGIAEKLQAGVRVLSPLNASEHASYPMDGSWRLESGRNMVAALLELMAVEIVKELPKNARGNDLDCGLVNLNSAALGVLNQGYEEMRAEAHAARALLQRIRDGEKVPKAEIEAVLKGGAK